MAEHRYFYSHTRNSFLLLIETILALVVLAVAGVIGAFFLSGGYSFVVENFDLSKIIPVQNTKVLLTISIGIAVVAVLYLAFVVSDFINHTALATHRESIKVGRKVINRVLGYRSGWYRPQYYIFAGDLVARYRVGREEYFAAEEGDRMVLTLPVFSRQPVEVELLKNSELEKMTKAQMKEAELNAAKRMWFQKVRQPQSHEVTDYETPE